MSAGADEAARIRNEVRVEKRLTPTHRLVRFAVGQRIGLDLPLSAYVQAICPRYPVELIARWCGDGRLTVDGGPARPDQGVRPGQIVELHATLPPLDPTYTVPPLVILHHDDDVVIADKAIGQLAHQAGQIMSGTLLNQVQDWVQARGGDPNQVRLVNRIDRDTGGIVLASRNLAAHQALSAALAARQVRKEYLAICHGRPATDHGHWTEPLGPDPAGTVRRLVTPDGQPSHTEWRVEAATADYALLRITLHTGRQHQIRVHAAHHGHPLVGDWVYGTPCAELPGQALHAAELAFIHPTTNRELCVTAPATTLMELWGRVLAGHRIEPIPLNEGQRSKLTPNVAGPLP